VIKICRNCGALILEDTGQCSFCNASLDLDETRQPVAVPSAASVPFAFDEPGHEQFIGSYSARQGAQRRAAAEPAGSSSSSDSDSAEPDWRREVARRLEDYRARRRRLHPDDPQSGLPFHEEISLEEEEEPVFCETPESRPRPSHRANRTERVEICVQPELDFSASSDDRAHPQSPLVPVADVQARRWAGLLDAIFLGFTCAGFFGLFRSLGGEMLFDKVDALVYGAVVFLFYGLYFFLFTTFAGATPGMQLRALTIVRLDGTLPETAQLLWRSFGYVLSGATLFLGFVWALWDEDHFTWQDRISRTYITAAVPVMDSASFAAPPGARPLAHR
jgi:uncharacterized RDD family membrane protein YckC